MVFMRITEVLFDFKLMRWSHTHTCMGIQGERIEDAIEKGCEIAIETSVPSMTMHSVQGRKIPHVLPLGVLASKMEFL